MWYHNIPAKTKDDLLYYVAEHLVQTQVFRGYLLSLYCGALALDMTFKGDSPAPSFDKNWRCDYLFCLGNTALLSVNLTPEEQDSEAQPAALPGLLMLNFPRKDPDAEMVENISSTVEQALAKILDEGLYSDWSFSGLPVSRQHLCGLAGAGLLERTDSGYHGSGPFWRPTQYGLDCGLNSGYAAVYVGGYDGEDGTIRRFPYYSGRVSPVIVDILKWSIEADAGMQWKKIISFDQRLARLKQGLPSDCAYSARVVRQMADMPLDSYLREFPEDLTELRETLPMLKDDATYQDAAVLIYRLSLPRHKWPKELRTMPIEYSDLMGILAKPLLKEWQRKKKRQKECRDN